MNRRLVFRRARLLLLAGAPLASAGRATDGPDVMRRELTACHAARASSQRP